MNFLSIKSIKNQVINTFFGVIILSFLVACTNKKQSDYETIKNAPLLHADGYVGDKACITCHKEETAHWKNSHHDLAMQVANNKTVLGDFKNRKITIDGVSYHFYIENNNFWVHIKEIDETEKTYKISYTFGITPLQQYLVDFKDGKKQVLRVTWDSVNNKWFHQYASNTISPHDWLHWTKSSQNWNTMCASCHSTNLKKNYNAENDTFNTTYSVINVSCESCHGPAERHINWAKTKTKNEPLETTFIEKGNTQLSQINMCAPCHSRRTNLTANFIPNQSFSNQFLLQDISEDFYHKDGQIKEEDYVLGSFLQSKMYHENVTCTDCHNPHTLKLKKQGNELCLQCHESSFNEPSHHFHTPNSESAQCVNCHMTGKTYMGNDFRRDHSFRIPRPDQSVLYNTPNACTGCHNDKSNKWAAAKIVDWYGTERSNHFSDALLLTYKNNISEEEREKVLNFINDLQYPAIARATAINNIVLETENDVAVLLKSLSDKSPIVRFYALQKFTILPEEDRISIASKHINDSIKLVRIGAVQLLNGVATEKLVKIDANRYSKAKTEYENMLFANADFSTGNAQLGNYYLQNNTVNLAIKYYEKALAADELLTMIYPNLATSYNLIGNSEKALKTLEKWIALEPNSSYAYYLRGLLYFELNENKKAISDLVKANSLDKSNTRILYNLATYYYQNKDFKQAQFYCNKALSLDPKNQEFNYLATLISQNR